MNRLTVIGLASLVAYGLLLTTKYMGVVSAAREGKTPVAALDEGPIGSAVIGAQAPVPAPRRVSLPPPLPRTEPMRASATAVDFRTARDLRVFADSLGARRGTLSADESYFLAKALEECQFTTTVNEDVAAYGAKQRRQFLAGLTPGDPNNPRRIAAFDAVDSTQRCARFQGTKISQKDIEDLYLASAQQGDARAQARMLVAELNAKSRAAVPEAAANARIGDQMSQLISLLESRDPEALMIVGGFLAQNAVASTLHIGTNGEIPEPSAFLGAFSLAACQMVEDCVQLSREPQMACAYGGYCDAATYEELYYNFMASPYTYMQAVRYRNVIITALNTRDWALIGLTPKVAERLAGSH